jgi:hypothetical protein
VTWGGFRRGFVAEASFFDFDALRSHADACWAAAPIEAVAIGWPRPEDSCEHIPPVPGLRELSFAGHTAFGGDVNRLARAPLLSTLRVLNVSACELGPEGFCALAASPHLRGLKALRAPGNSVGNVGIDAIRAGQFAALEGLDLSEDAVEGYQNGYGYGEEESSVINVDGMGLLAEWPGLARLRTLKLSGNNLGRDGLRALLRSEGVAGLKQLVLRGVGLPEDVGRDFYDANPELQLDVLDIAENMQGDDVYDYLGRAASLSELKALDVGRCEMRMADMRRVVEGSFIGSLRMLDISHNTLGADGLYALLTQQPKHLHTLKLRDTDVGNDGAAYLAESPSSDVLLEVDLAGNRLSDRGANALTATKHLRSLLVLRLGDNSIGERAAGALAASELGKRLAVLDMGKQEERS